MQQLIDQSKERVEFVWIAGYNISGMKLYGDGEAPDSIIGKEYYDYLTVTQNLTIGNPEYANGRILSEATNMICSMMSCRILILESGELRILSTVMEISLWIKMCRI